MGEQQDWPHVIEFLRSRGFTDRKIGERVGCTMHNVWLLCSGKNAEPRFELGRRLMDLYAEAQQLPPPRDWSVVVSELRKGYTVDEIAGLIDCHPNTVTNLTRYPGRRPSERLQVELLKLLEGLS